ncbi:methyltransferase domain-containing protein [Beijerinckia sp. L45]|uniref:methyltransferase domain-containing protein n=1 Tax=Beijerinckia sp. L45 TaxID=1641855 RepID=UPI00131D1F54|nr:methyltransferase domain-containing protein [Beijerinckia sp. L45]
MTAPPPIFDRALLRRRLERALAQGPADFLLTRVVEDLDERLAVVQKRFAAIVDIGTPSSGLAQRLAARFPDATTTRIAPLPAPGSAGTTTIGDLEILPLAPETCDLAVSALALQSANDLPGALVQIRRALKPDGLFLGAMLGGRTLHELRTVLTEAETALTGGVSPRVAPFADVRDMGGLLQRAGFALPVADSDVVIVRYDNLFGLMRDLRAMGATNPLVDRTRRPTSRLLFLQAAALYAARFADPDGRIRATFEVISLSGWAPHESQQKPAKRGSATISLADALKPKAG